MKTKPDIFLVDDQPENLKILGYILKKQGYKVDTFIDGESALDSVFKMPPNLILLDIRMPGLDGYEVCRRLKANEHTCDIPIVFLSAVGDTDAKIKAFAVGGIDYITKPLNEAEVVARVSTHFKLYKAQQALKDQNVELQETIQNLERETIGRGQAETALQQSEEKFRRLFQTMTMGVIYHQATGEIIAANPAAEKILGLTLGQLQGRTSIDPRWKAVHEDGSAFPGQDHPAMVALRTGKNVKDVVMGVFNPADESYRWINVTAIPELYPGQDKPYQVYAIFDDITARVEATEALKKKHLKLVDAQKSTHIGNWSHDLTTDEIFWSEESFRIMEIEEQELTPEKVLSSIHPDDLPILLNAIEESTKGKTGIAHEFRIIRPTGEIRYLYNQWASVYDECGKEIKRVGTHQDITERRQAENILKARLRLVEFFPSHSMTELLQATLDEAEALTDSRIGFYHFLDTDQTTLRLQAWSTGTVAKMCIPTEQPLRSNVADAGIWVDCIYKRHPVIHNNYTSQPHRKGLPEGHAEIIRELVVPVIRDNKIVAVLGVGNKPYNYAESDVSVLSRLADLAWDLVERKRVEDALQDIQARNIAMLNAIPDLMLLLSRDGEILEVKAKNADDLIVKSEDAIGSRISDSMPVETAKLLLNRIEQALDTFQMQEFEFQTQEKPQNFEARLVAANDDKVLALVRNVTERNQMQERIQQQEQLAAVGQLAAGIAHDFNNLLTTIIGYAELLRMDSNIPAFAQHDLERILQQGERAAQLTRQILDFSRKSIRNPHPLEMVEILNEAVKFLRRTISEKIQIRLVTGQNSYTVNVDPTQLQQVITNLSVNARDAMPHGGELLFDLSKVTITPDTVPSHPDMQPGEWVKLIVSDTGTGISPEALPHIFEPFFTTKGVGEGTGLGLAQVYGIVTQNEGFITVNSLEGQGTTFTVFFPSVPDKMGAEKRKIIDLMTVGQGETILLVEDDPMVLEVAQSMLEMLNFQVLTATNGQDALAVFRKNSSQIDLILTDTVMPTIDGITLVRTLQAESPTIKIVLMSGYPHGEELTPEVKQSIAGWLQKPLSVQQLATTLKEALINT